MCLWLHDPPGRAFLCLPGDWPSSHGTRPWASDVLFPLDVSGGLELNLQGSVGLSPPPAAIVLHSESRQGTDPGESGFWALCGEGGGVGAPGASPRISPGGLSVSSLGRHSAKLCLVRNVAVPPVSGGNDGQRSDVCIVSRVAHTCFSLTRSCGVVPLSWKDPRTFQFIPSLSAQC